MMMNDDMISRQNVLRCLTDISYNHCKTQGEADVIDTAKTMVAVMSSAQPEIIRCRDCIHLKRSETNSKLMMCRRRGRLLNLVGEFDFCSKADMRGGTG